MNDSRGKKQNWKDSYFQLPWAPEHRSAVPWGQHWQCSAAAQLAGGKQGAAQDPAGSDVKCNPKAAPSDSAGPAADQRENLCGEKTSAAMLFLIRGRRLQRLLLLQLHKNLVFQTLADFLTYSCNPILAYLVPLLTKRTVSGNWRSDVDLDCLVINTERDIAILTLKNMRLKNKNFKCNKKSIFQRNHFKNYFSGNLSS